MIRNYFLLLCTLFCCFSSSARPRRRSWLRKKAPVVEQPVVKASPLKRKPFLLTKAIHDIVEQAGKKAATGIKVISLKTNKCIYEKDADTLFIPASNTKLLTAGAAYHLLGADFCFQTELSTDRQLSSNRINNLYIKGSGDPSLTTKDLESLVHQLKKDHIREIKGDIILDASIFDDVPLAPGESKGDGPIFDKSPVAGFTVNHSCVTVRVKPARSLRRRPLVFLDPYLAALPIDNRALTVGGSKKQGIWVSRTDDHIVVNGTIAIHSSAKSYRITVKNPPLYAAQLFVNLLKQHKIVVRGRLLMGKVPQDVQRLAVHRSAPLNSLIKFMMKGSDNLYANTFFKKMGELKYGAPGTWAKGKKAVEAFLTEEVKLSPEAIALFDGSGLSHSNRISPNNLMQFLSWVYTSSRFRTLFIDSLPISGIDGSLRHRMKHKTTRSKVKAKTGNLPGVTSLSGYITPLRADETPLAFVIMVNRKNQSAVHYKRQLEDELCRLLAAHAYST